MMLKAYIRTIVKSHTANYVHTTHKHNPSTHNRL